MIRILFAIAIISTTGCGTYTCISVAHEDPRTQVIYGGVRTDINCIASSPEEQDKLYPYRMIGRVGDCVLKTCSVIDLPLSFICDTISLPYAIRLHYRNKSLPRTEEVDASTETKAPKEDIANMDGAAKPVEIWPTWLNEYPPPSTSKPIIPRP